MEIIKKKWGGYSSKARCSDVGTRTSKRGAKTQGNNEVIINDEEMEEDSGVSKGDSNTGENAEVGSKGDDDLSGLSFLDESDDDDDEPSIISYEEKKRRDNERNTNTPSSPSLFRKRRDSKSTFDFDLTDSPPKENKTKLHKVTPKKTPRSSLRLTPPPLANGGRGSSL